MKTFTLIKWFFIVMIIFPTFSCSVSDNEEDTSNDIGKVEISINLSEANVKAIESSALKTSNVVIKSVVISMTKKDGTLVYDKESISLLNMNGYYIASPISLNVGEYALTEFLVMDDANNVVYAAPLAGSAKAYLVKTPLSIDFEVKKDVVLKLAPEVINIGSSTPADFGYSTISFNVVPYFDFSLSAFVYNSTIQNWELTAATILIENEGTVLYNGALEAITNVISIRDDVSTYDMTISKSGCKTYVYSFSHDSLQYYKIDDNYEPLKIPLAKDVVVPSIEYVRVEGGTFLMGSDIGEDNEKPIHTVSINTFEMSKYEVTQAQFIKFLNEVNCKETGYCDDNEFGNVQYVDMTDADCSIGYVANQFYFKGSSMISSDDCPANEVTWFGANAYCEWVGGRLPYEAEWEFAARGGNNSNNFIYSGSNTYDDVAWTILNDDNQTHPVGQKLANELGIHDMSGNVYEWCFDRLGDYSSDSQINPTGSVNGLKRIRRGGGWNSDFIYCETTFRSFHYPEGSNNDDGIRVVREVN